MSQLIIGAGGGGKGGGGSARVAQEAPDSLRSKAYARVVDLISEGEIEGLVTGLQSVYLDDTPGRIFAENHASISFFLASR